MDILKLFDMVIVLLYLFQTTEIFRHIFVNFYYGTTQRQYHSCSCSTRVEQATSGSLQKIEHFRALCLKVKHRAQKEANLDKLPEVA